MTDTADLLAEIAQLRALLAGSEARAARLDAARLSMCCWAGAPGRLTQSGATHHGPGARRLFWQTR